jgi:hypothetical protein
LRDADRIHHPADAKNDHQSKNADRNFHGERGDATLGESRLK